MNDIKEPNDVIEYIISSIIMNDDFIRNPMVISNNENNLTNSQCEDNDSIDNENMQCDLNNTICVQYEKNPDISDTDEEDIVQYNETDRIIHANYTCVKSTLNDIILKIEYNYNIYSNVITNQKYHFVANSLRLFLIEQGFIECNKSFKNEYNHDKLNFFMPECDYYLLLESELLQNKKYSGFFVINDNCCEFIVRTENNIIDIIQQLLIYLSYNQKNTCNLKNYKYLASKTGQKILKITKYLSEKIYNKFGAILLLNELPLYLNESVFIESDDNYYKKMYVFLSGLETIIACNLSKDKLKIFQHIKNIKNVDQLNPYFSVLNNIFKHDLKERIYVKINIENLIKSMIHESLIPDLFS